MCFCMFSHYWLKCQQIFARCECRMFSGWTGYMSGCQATCYICKYHTSHSYLRLTFADFSAVRDRTLSLPLLKVNNQVKALILYYLTISYQSKFGLEGAIRKQHQHDNAHTQHTWCRIKPSREQGSLQNSQGTLVLFSRSASASSASSYWDSCSYLDGALLFLGKVWDEGLLDRDGLGIGDSRAICSAHDSFLEDAAVEDVEVGQHPASFLRTLVGFTQAAWKSEGHVLHIAPFYFCADKKASSIGKDESSHSY